MKHRAASSYGQLGILAGLQEHFEEAGKWLIKAMLVFKKCNAPAEVEQTANNFQVLYKQAEPEAQTKLKAVWEEAGLAEQLTIDN